MILRVLAVAAGAALLAGCTSSGGGSVPSIAQRSSSAPASQPTAPVDTGPTRVASAGSCRFATQKLVRNAMGMRLGRLTVLRSGGHVVGCRFYALQNSPLHQSEHLPGAHQPVLQITTQRYASATAARNAVVLLARAGKDAQRIGLGRATGVCFQAAFYSRDHGTDWACAANVGPTEVVVRSVDTTGSFSTAEVTRAVLHRV